MGWLHRVADISEEISVFILHGNGEGKAFRNIDKFSATFCNPQIVSKLGVKLRLKIKILKKEDLFYDVMFLLLAVRIASFQWPCL
jgi:hypothetical protein